MMEGLIFELTIMSLSHLRHLYAIFELLSYPEASCEDRCEFG